VVLRDGSQITVEAKGTANGGNLIVNSDTFAALSNSKVTANAITGDGGNISIRTQSIFLSPDSDITASSQLGVSGTVTVSTPEIDPSSGLVEPPKNPLDIESLVGKDFCEVSKDSEFVITGRGGIPLNPGDYLTGETIFVGLVDPVIRDNTLSSTSEDISGQRRRGVNNTSMSQGPRVSESSQIVEATGWIQHPDGTIELVALGAMTSPGWKPVDCQDLSSDD
jgi:large exoprotein involved in heme utilization and adhesion